MKRRDVIIIAASTVAVPVIYALNLVFIARPPTHPPAYVLSYRWHQLLHQPYAWVNWALLVMAGCLIGSIIAFAASVVRNRLRAGAWKPLRQVRL